MKLDREALIEEMADSASDSIDLKSLMEFYYNYQIDWLGELTDTELEEQATYFFHEFNREDYLEDSE